MTDAARSQWIFSKTEAVATNGMVTADPLAAEAGVEILRDGGNAPEAPPPPALLPGFTPPAPTGPRGVGVFREGKKAKQTALDRAHRPPPPPPPPMSARLCAAA